ncbi:MAG: hypothetical protein A2599_02980 [Candidatus Staskawiczbacteria bacterium RIFOXYD1_FULL_39_28]|uniref:BioF2-like acetyltransferase domain-containing protein n=1 Tax=Candidatus Staskawiczbacteria bacterium RIFOXYC1_FULL_38_18 TaxID=1802229 RepID=A0A1G2JBV2_9BACT|nr:MAG: hypothetical protein A2401_01025 [Candidatus Staskawiczbacteria bacterium RIFOXYC1_FULL_38_18]OGZ92339.1 MAG: hypothetical protein A2599_02980 [Candidatus Staskawiczbacteria bacterium RIFOXYD1_FULL_39_28]
MEIREITNKDEWEDFLGGCTEKTFLQSWNWGEFCAPGAPASGLNLGNKIWRFGIFDNEKLVSVAMAIKVLAKRGTFLFIPHGPVFSESSNIAGKKQILELIIIRLDEIAKEEKASFIRISPLLLKNEENNRIFEDLNFRPSPMHSSAYEATWKLDIFFEEGELLKNMRKTTRYLIRKATENQDISIEISADPINIEVYQKLNKAVSKRQNFIPFSDSSIKNEFEIFKKDNQAVFLFGKYKGETVAGAMVIFWQGIAYYHQAASVGKYSKFSIPYLLQWRAILEAKRRGCKIYDFWGFTDPEKFPHHPWAGPTLFKMGFGGYKEEYVQTQDFVLSPKYWFNYIIELIRAKRRGL